MMSDAKKDTAPASGELLIAVQARDEGLRCSLCLRLISLYDGVISVPIASS